VRPVQKQKLNISGGAEVLGVSPFTLGAWVRARRVPHYRIGRRIVFDGDQLREWLEAHKVEATAAGKTGETGRPQ